MEACWIDILASTAAFGIPMGVFKYTVNVEPSGLTFRAPTVVSLLKKILAVLLTSIDMLLSCKIYYYI